MCSVTRTRMRDPEPALYVAPDEGRCRVPAFVLELRSVGCRTLWGGGVGRDRRGEASDDQPTGEDHLLDGWRDHPGS